MTGITLCDKISLRFSLMRRDDDFLDIDSGFRRGCKALISQDGITVFLLVGHGLSLLISRRLLITALSFVAASRFHRKPTLLPRYASPASYALFALLMQIGSPRPLAGCSPLASRSLIGQRRRHRPGEEFPAGFPFLQEKDIRKRQGLVSQSATRASLVRESPMPRHARSALIS